jgi:hypothetical protein
MTIIAELDIGWKQTDSPKMLYLAAPDAKITIHSDTLNHVNLAISVTSCIEEKQLTINVNDETLYFGEISCELFKKISFESILVKGANNIEFMVTSKKATKKTEIPNDKDIPYLLAIKDFDIIRYERMKIL